MICPFYPARKLGYRMQDAGPTQPTRGFESAGGALHPEPCIPNPASWTLHPAPVARQRNAAGYT